MHVYACNVATLAGRLPFSRHPALFEKIRIKIKKHPQVRETANQNHLWMY